MTTPARKLTARYRPLRAISVADIEEMHTLFSSFYENADVPTFLRDLSQKDGAILVRDKRSRRICGFTTIKRVPLWDGKRRAMGIFSGDTVMDASCWGDRTLKDAFTRHLLFLWLTCPGTPLYWLLISKGYKTYMLLVNNFVDFHPRPDGRVDQRLQRLVRDYTDQLFPGKYDEARGVLNFGEGSQRLREEVAPITAEMRLQNPAINYFEQRNPGWRLGHELPCIARISIRLLKPYLLKERRKSAAAWSAGSAPAAGAERSGGSESVEQDEAASARGPLRQAGLATGRRSIEE